MTANKVDLILHPVRMRIVVAMSGHQRTAQELQRLLPDVAQATLYRHLNTLYEADLLKVVEERPVRGTVEKVYALQQEDLFHLSEADLQNASKDDHLRYFSTFLVTLMADFGRYLNETPTPQFAQDGVGYHTLPLYMNDDEVLEFSQKLQALLLAYAQPQPERKRLLFSTIIMPSMNAPDEADASDKGNAANEKESTA